MPRRAAQLVSLLVVLILILSDLLAASPVPTGIEAARVAAPVADPGVTSDPALASKQSRRKHERKQRRRHERQQDRKQKRNRADHRRDVKERRAKARTGETRQDCTGPNIMPLRGLGLCTHGPDEAPPEFRGSAEVPVLSDTVAAQEAAAIACDGDGQSGFRTQVLYIYDSSKTNNLGSYLRSIQAWSAQMDEIFRASSMETGPVRSVRFVQDPDTCLPVVLGIGISPSAINSFSATINQLVNLGYARQDRIYLMFADATTYCGIGTFSGNDSPFVENENNIGPSYSRVDRFCWSGTVAAHEVMHNLGGVQYSAPNTSRGAHCIDEYDIMCYRDSPYYPQMQIVCPNPADDDLLLDCNHDDYFNTDPAPGSYLATHWNPANNRFLTNAPPLAPAPPPPPPAAEPGGGDRGRTSRQRHKDRKQRKQKQKQKQKHKKKQKSQRR